MVRQRCRVHRLQRRGNAEDRRGKGDRRRRSSSMANIYLRQLSAVAPLYLDDPCGIRGGRRGSALTGETAERRDPVAGRLACLRRWSPMPAALCPVSGFQTPRALAAANRDRPSLLPLRRRRSLVPPAPPLLSCPRSLFPTVAFATGSAKRATVAARSVSRHSHPAKYRQPASLANVFCLSYI